MSLPNSDPGDEQPEKPEPVLSSDALRIPLRVDPMVPPGAIELHDDDGIVYRGWL